jgi:uncharacterized protein YjeT (DUF2065 family)
MLKIEQLWRLPVLTLIGLVLMAVGLVADLVVHAAHHHGPAEHAAHLVGLVGMVLVLAGVMAFGARRQLQQRNGGDRNAHR